MANDKEAPKPVEGEQHVRTTTEILATLHETQQVIASTPFGMGSGSN